MKGIYFGILKFSIFPLFFLYALNCPPAFTLPIQHSAWCKATGFQNGIPWSLLRLGINRERTRRNTSSFVTIFRTPKKDSKIPIFTGPQELHITADIAWATSKYWDATLDHEFMCNYGVEILVETARFWVSRVVLYENHYHLKEVVGPDEYHYGTTDNAFTNWMVRFNLDAAIRMITWISEAHPKSFAKISSKLNLTPNEVPDWQDVFKRLSIPQAGENGVIEQFEGLLCPEGGRAVWDRQNPRTDIPTFRLENNQSSSDRQAG